MTKGWEATKPARTAFSASGRSRGMAASPWAWKARMTLGSWTSRGGRPARWKRRWGRLGSSRAMIRRVDSVEKAEGPPLLRWRERM
jgi:hypothetical protein